METPSVLAVVLSFNGTADTLECLESLRHQTCPGLSILIIDNASVDGAPQAIRSQYPEMELIVLPVNLGWAGGNNVGIRVAQERNIDLVCLLNNDLVLPPDALALLAQAYCRSKPCLLHPSIYYYDNPGTPQLDPSADGSGRKLTQAGLDRDIWEITAAYGACLMVSTEAFRQVGLFDERFFLQLEETDFSLRAHRQGMPALCLPTARILHKESVSFGGVRAPIKTYYSIRNQLLLAEKHTPPGSGKFLRAMKSVYWQLRTLHSKTASGNFLRWLMSRNAHAIATRRGFFDYLARRFGKIGDRSAAALAAATT